MCITFSLWAAGSTVYYQFRTKRFEKLSLLDDAADSAEVSFKLDGTTWQILGSKYCKIRGFWIAMQGGFQWNPKGLHRWVPLADQDKVWYISQGF